MDVNKNYFFSGSLLGLILQPVIGLVFLLLSSSASWAAGNQTLTKQLISSSTAKTGEIVEYRIGTACSTNTSNCGNLSISDNVPAEMEVVSCSTPPGFTVNSCTTGSPIQISKNAIFDGGDSFNITVKTRIKAGTPGGTIITNSAEAVITDPETPANGNLVASAPPVTTSVGTPQWEVRKKRIDPKVSLLPAVDTRVRYQLDVCSLTSVGNVGMDGVILIDSYTANATVDDSDGGVVNGGSSTIEWDLGNLDIATLYAGKSVTSVQCISKNVTLIYPGASFNVNDPVPNTATATGTPQEGSGGIGQATQDTENDVIGAPTPGASVSKYAADITPPDELRWRLNANNSNSNVPLDDFIVVDELPGTSANTPGPVFKTTRITSGKWPSLYGYLIEASVEYATVVSPGSGDWTVIQSGLDGTSLVTWTSPGNFPNNITHVRWVFSNTGTGPANQIPRSFSFTSQPNIYQDVPSEADGTVIDDNPTNCMTASFSGGTAGPACDTPNIELPKPAINVKKSRLTANNINPGSDVQYKLEIDHVWGNSTSSTVNPVLADLLPAEMEFVSWDDYQGPSGKKSPNLEIIDDYKGTGRSLLRFSWQDTAPSGSIQIDGSLGADNPEQFEHTISSSSMPSIKITVRSKAGTAAGSYTNEVVFFDNSPRFVCSNNGTDTNDLDDDTDTAETVCKKSTSVTVISAAVLGGSKWIKGDYPALANIDDPSSSPATSDLLCPNDGEGYTRFPCVAQTKPGQNFDYRLRLENTGNIELTNYIMYDMLPHLNDVGSGEPLKNSLRDTKWRPLLTGPIVPEDGYTTSVLTETGAFVEYSTAANPCRPEVSSSAVESPADHWQAGCDNSWGVLPADPATVTAFRIHVPFASVPYWEPGKQLRFRVPMMAPLDTPPSIPGDASIFNPAWNSIAHRASEKLGVGESRLNTAEPKKVGIIVPPKYRLGNLVWWDLDDNGIANSNEPGISSVTLQLWQDTDSSGTVTAADTMLESKVTDLEGHYQFSQLEAGDYYVVVPEGQTVLNGFSSSSTGEENAPNSDGDNNDNGVNPVSLSGGANGLASGLVSLGTGGSEPLNEVLRNGSASDDDNDDFPDSLSNYSVDFGYHLPSVAPAVAGPPVSIGSTVFLDPNNNGIQDGTEAGISGVSVQLFWPGSDNAMGGGDDILVKSMSTNGSGNYFFDNLIPGNYFIKIPAPPASAPVSSTPTSTTDNSKDGDDNGSQSGGAGTEVISPIIALAVDQELAGETFQGGGQDTADDDNGDMTVDFGFLNNASLVASYVSIGSTVFLDPNNNGIQDSGDAGISGVTVKLYLAGPDNKVGGGDDVLVASKATDGNGDYLFGQLLSGQYYIKISTPPAHAPLSSQVTAILDNQNDGDDNGIQASGVGTVVNSPVIALAPNSEPSGETYQGGDQDDTDDDNGDMTVDFGFTFDNTQPIPAIGALGYSFLMVFMGMLGAVYKRKFQA
ncbi:MAG: SdrD B-like domain-containing protein [Methylococcaceae bacterium]